MTELHAHIILFLNTAFIIAKKTILHKNSIT